MHQRAKKGLALALATGGLLFVGTGAAQADAGATSSSSGDNGVLTGNNIDIPINAPINVCGDSIGVLGVAFDSTCHIVGGGEGGGNSATVAQSSHDDNGFIAGNNVGVPVNLPVNVCGDSVGVVGVASDSHCDVDTGHGRHRGNAAHAAGSQTGDNGAITGNGVDVPVNAPVNVCGDSISVLGVTKDSACEIGGGGHHRGPHVPPTTPVTPITTPVTPPGGGGQHTPPPPHYPGGGGSMTPTHGATTVPTTTPVLAHTGADDTLGLAAAAGGMLLGGAALTRVGARRRG